MLSPAPPTWIGTLLAGCARESAARTARDACVPRFPDLRAIPLVGSNPLPVPTHTNTGSCGPVSDGNATQCSAPPLGIRALRAGCARPSAFGGTLRTHASFAWATCAPSRSSVRIPCRFRPTRTQALAGLGLRVRDWDSIMGPESPIGIRTLRAGCARESAARTARDACVPRFPCLRAIPLVGSNPLPVPTHTNTGPCGPVSGGNATQCSVAPIGIRTLRAGCARPSAFGGTLRTHASFAWAACAPSRSSVRIPCRFRPTQTQALAGPCSCWSGR